MARVEDGFCSRDLPEDVGLGWFGLLCLALLVLALAGCGTPGYVSAEAIQPSWERIRARHDAYTKQDKALTDVKRRANLRDTELLGQVLEEAQRPKEASDE